MAQSNSYWAKKKREERELAKEIYKYHGWEKMPFESDKDFRRRFTKRTVIVWDDNSKSILGPFGKPIKKGNRL